MKIDNTYEYKLPPFFIEAFCQYMLESDEGIQRLMNLYQNYPLKIKPKYNIMDYINAMDYVVRSMELTLGIQNIGLVKPNHSNRIKDWCYVQSKIARSEPSVTPRWKTSLEYNTANIKLQPDSVISGNKTPVEFNNSSEIDYDDVFANNPSNLMLAKVKVK